SFRSTESTESTRSCRLRLPSDRPLIGGHWRGCGGGAGFERLLECLPAQRRALHAYRELRDTEQRLDVAEVNVRGRLAPGHHLLERADRLEGFLDALAGDVVAHQRRR